MTDSAGARWWEVPRDQWVPVDPEAEHRLDEALADAMRQADELYGPDWRQRAETQHV